MSVSNKITLKHIVSVVKHAYSSPKMPTVLGRWIRYDDDDEKIKLKVHYSNEDHCGTCSEYSLEKLSNYDDNKKQQVKEVYPLVVDNNNKLVFVSPRQLQPFRCINN